MDVQELWDLNNHAKTLSDLADETFVSYERISLKAQAFAKQRKYASDSRVGASQPTPSLGADRKIEELEIAIGWAKELKTLLDSEIAELTSRKEALKTV